MRQMYRMFNLCMSICIMDICMQIFIRYNDHQNEAILINSIILYAVNKFKSVDVKKKRVLGSIRTKHEKSNRLTRQDLGVVVA